MPPRGRRNPNAAFMALCAFFVLGIYFVFYSLREARRPPRAPLGPLIQHQDWNGTGSAQASRAQEVKKAMLHSFKGYKAKAWGADDVKPITGGKLNSRNGWGAFIVDTASTIAFMGLWNELSLEIDYIMNGIDFTRPEGLVDPFETTIRYLGGLLSLVDLIDAGVVPSTVVTSGQRDTILEQAQLLADNLAAGFDTPTGLIWPRINFTSAQGEADPPDVFTDNPDKIKYDNPVISPARAGSCVLENRVLSRLTGEDIYLLNATKAWAPLVWPQYVREYPGLVDAPIDLYTGAPVGRQRHWDAGHDSYYEYLIKASILAPHDRYSATYTSRWLAAADAIRHNLTSRSSPAPGHTAQHLFLGKLDGPHYVNEMSTLACFVPGNLILGGKYLNRPDLIHLGQALLEGCRHTYATSPTGIGPELFSWTPMAPGPKGIFKPETARQEAELDEYGFWVADSRYRLRPEYVESLFYAFRVTGESRYRDWAWEAFLSYQQYCKTPIGYASIRDVMVAEEDDAMFTQWMDESESFWGAETLKYLWLIFEDVGVGSLDSWVYTTEGHALRRVVEAVDEERAVEGPF